MSDPSITKGQHHVSFPAQPDVSGDPVPDRLVPLDMILRFSEGRQFRVYLAKEPCSALVRELLTALTALCDFGGTINSPGRAEKYTVSIRKFVRFLADRSAPQECTLTVSDLTPQDLDTFEAYLRGTGDPRRECLPLQVDGIDCSTVTLVARYAS